MSNRKRFDKARAELMLKLQSNVAKATASLHSKIMLKSPVDTGALRRSWVVAEESPYSFVISTDKPYAKVLEYGLYPNPPKGGKGKTEDGYSKQAPQGFVRKSIEEVANEFK